MSASSPHAPPVTGRVAVLIPALDEEPTIGSVIRALPAELVDEIVVADNGSRDATPRIARDLGAVVVAAPRLGYGSACLAGMRHLARRPPAIVVFLDADGSDDPSGLARLIDPIRSGAADMVLGVRTGDPPRRAAARAHGQPGRPPVRAPPLRAPLPRHASLPRHSP